MLIAVLAVGLGPPVPVGSPLGCRIEDTYWTERDYVGPVERAGLTVTTIAYPRPGDSSAWSTDEASVPPFIVIEARKGVGTQRAGTGSGGGRHSRLSSP